MINTSGETLRSFVDDRLVHVSIFLNMLFNILAWSVFGWVARKVPESTPLHYNIYFGINLYGPWWWLLAGPGLGLLVIILNFYIGHRLFNKERIASYFLVVASTVVQLLIIFSGISLIYLSSV